MEELRALQPEDWPDIIPDIEMYIRLPFCYPIKVMIDNKIAGIGTSIVFGETGWLAHIIVHPDFRNKGIGMKIVNELLDHQKSQHVSTSLLIATELGRPVYLKSGFKEVSNYVYLKREIEWAIHPVSKNIIPFKVDHLEQILKLDRHITGESRENLLVDYLSKSFVYLNRNIIEGYYIPNLKEGPIYAAHEKAGIELMKIKYATADKAVLPAENIAAISFLKQNGFIETNTKGTRMILGELINWRPEMVYSRIGGNLG
jgi:GNAT superfamily N-acetyltransferase